MSEQAGYLLRVTLRSDLCAGSGSSGGITVDRDVCVDAFGLPCLPARRIKGVLRAAAEMLTKYDDKQYPRQQLESVFGTASAPGLLRLRDAELPGVGEMRSCLRRVRADESHPLHAAAQPLNVTRLFTSVRGQTRMEDGVAAEGSLRYTRVLNHYSPLYPGEETVLEAEVLCPEVYFAYLKTCCAAVKHIGLGRNRGLGAVSLQLCPAGKAEDRERVQPAEGEQLLISYTVSLDAPVTLPGCGELLREIPARSVIGCMAAADSGDPAFRALFLTGEVQWSALTPQVNGLHTTPAPLMLTYLKNESSYCNRYAVSTEEIEGKKQKTVDGAYAARTEDGFRIAVVRSHTIYHHSTGSDGTLYTQESLDAGMLYSGTVRVPARYAETVLELLRTAPLTFGRSKTAQYAACSLVGTPKCEHVDQTTVDAKPGEIVYVLLEADLIPVCGALRRSDAQAVRDLLAAELGVSPAPEKDLQDYCQFHTVSGYQAMWHLQKQQMTAVRGGSVFCFRAGTEPIARQVRVGALPQEGFGACRVFSQAEMLSLTDTAKAPADAAPGSDAGHPALEAALLAAETRRVMRETARDYEVEAAKQQLNTGMLGRLRSTLAAAKSYEALLAEIREIPASDTSSENPVPRRDRALALVTGLYERVQQELVRAGLRGEGEKNLSAEWKQPLELLLHQLYYRRNRKEGAK